MKTKLLLIFVAVGGLIAGCKSNKHPSVPSLRPNKVKLKFKDSTYLSYPWNIQKYGKNFFIDDAQNHRVLKLDSTLMLQKIIGRQGNGPGEFQFAGAMVAYNDSLYVYDSGTERFNVYDFNGHPLRTFHIIPYPLHNSRIARIGNRLYLSSSSIVNHPSSIFITNLNGQLIKYFNADPSDDPRLNLSNRYLFAGPDSNQIIAISESEPFVERYSASGTFLGSFDLQKVHVLDPLWNYYEQQKKQDTRYHTYNLFTDAYLDDSMLYILCGGWPGRDHYTYILRLKVDNQTIKPMSVFKIRGTKKNMDLFQSIAVSGNELIAFDLSTRAICKFNLDQLK